MNKEIGWHFPPTNGGRIDGFNDPGIAHFTGAPLGKPRTRDDTELARRPVMTSDETGACLV